MYGKLHFYTDYLDIRSEQTEKPICRQSCWQIVYNTDLGPITCQCNRLQLQLLSKTMITDYNYNYIFLNVIDYNYNYFAK